MFSLPFPLYINVSVLSNPYLSKGVFWIDLEEWNHLRLQQKVKDVSGRRAVGLQLQLQALRAPSRYCVKGVTFDPPSVRLLVIRNIVVTLMCILRFVGIEETSELDSVSYYPSI